MDLLKQSYVKYGLMMVGLLVVCLLLMEVTGDNLDFNKSPIFLIYQFLLPAVIWYLGIKARKRVQKGKLTYKQGLAEGFKISLVFAIVSPLVFGAYYLFVNPAIVDHVKVVYGMSDVSTSVVITLDLLIQFVSALIFGTIYGAIITLFIKNKA